MPTINRAILSCYDKEGLVELAETLREYKVELVATEGTRQNLESHKIEAQSIADFTGTREMLNGRVKSLHPKVHAGLLAIRDRKIHQQEMETYDYQWIDMVVINLHPIEELMTDARPTDEVMEQIDIGGIAMIRSAAKNFRYVTVIVNPERYSTVLHELRANEGSITFPTRFRLAQEALATTARYDQILAEYLHRCNPPKE